MDSTKQEAKRRSICREYGSDCEICKCGYIINTGCDERPEVSACGFYKGVGQDE